MGTRSGAECAGFPGCAPVEPVSFAIASAPVIVVALVIPHRRRLSEFRRVRGRFPKAGQPSGRADSSHPVTALRYGPVPGRPCPPPSSSLQGFDRSCRKRSSIARTCVIVLHCDDAIREDRSTRGGNQRANWEKNVEEDWNGTFRFYWILIVLHDSPRRGSRQRYRDRTQMECGQRMCRAFARSTRSPASTGAARHGSTLSFEKVWEGF